MKRNTYQKMTPEKVLDLASYLVALFIEKGMWSSAIIFFQGRTFQTDDWGTEDEQFCVRDSEGEVHTVCIAREADPKGCLRFCGDILSVICEGGLTDFCLYDKDFLALDDELYEKYGLYFELGEHWNMSLYSTDAEIDDLLF